MKKVYKEKINTLYEKALIDKLDISTIDNGYFSDTSDDLMEFTNWFQRLVKKFKIGTRISKQFWGDQKRREIQKLIYDNLKTQLDGKISMTKNRLQIYDEIKDKIAAKGHTSYDYQRIARTETANVKAVYQLLSYKEAGIKYVKHVTRNDSKVSEICKLHNNRIFEIDYLLSPQGERDRIPLHPNCRCRYVPIIK